ncbi:MAG: GNAT family N-acetyltransferase [Anaerolineales bacterium]
MTEPLLDVPALADFVIRPPKMEDAQAVSDLSNTHSQHLFGTNQSEAVDFESAWQSPGFDLENSARLVFTREGQLVAYFDVRDQQAPHVRIRVNVLVHPDFQESGMPEAMLAWVEARAREAVSKAPDGAQVIMATNTNHIDTWKKKLLEGHGMEVIRYFLRMGIEFDEPPQLSVVPEGIMLRPYDPETELEKLALIYKDSFRDHFGYVDEPQEEMIKALQHWIATDPDHDPELWLVAADGDRLAALAICVPRVVEDPEMGAVYILGVGREWRGQGLGMAILRYAFTELHKKGCKRVSLDVDASSLTGATRLYEKAGMSVYRQFDAYSKILREGEDISTTAL